jgi:hypothetical protein
MLLPLPGYRTAQIRYCRVFRLLPVLIVFAMTLSLCAQEYEVDGSVDLQLSRPDKSLWKEYRGSFRVYVKGCAWLIQVTEMNDWGLPLRREVGTSDGQETYEMVVPYEAISASDPVVFDVKASPPGVHLAPSATVTSNAIPVGDDDGSFTGHLWLMFASGFYLRTAAEGQLTPVFLWGAAPHMNNQATMKANWELINVPGSLPSRVTFFEPDGTPAAVYTATGLTNVGAVALPTGFSFIEPVTGFKKVTAVVTAVRPICSRADLRPALKQRVDMYDLRCFDENDRNDFPVYEAGYWPTIKEAQRIYSSTRSRYSGAPPSKLSIVMVLGLMIGPPVIIVLSKLRLRSQQPPAKPEACKM